MKSKFLRNLFLKKCSLNFKSLCIILKSKIGRFGLLKVLFEHNLIVNNRECSFDVLMFSKINLGNLTLCLFVPISSVHGRTMEIR